MTSLPEIVEWLEGDDALQLGRILVLLRAFGGKGGNQPIEGLTKLAKLDFLLRYPTYLERALAARGVSEQPTSVEDYERNSVEAHMVRYRYGPWDHRYRRFLNTLVGLGLVAVQTDKRTIIISLTQEGERAAEALVSDPSYATMASRATLLKRHFNLTATTLMEFIYRTFPEVVSLSLGETIER
jgi:hypothetical protein